MVSIVVPARNEQVNLPALLASLARLEGPPSEIIVVDDQSDDDTAAVAASFGVRVVRTTPTPTGWSGKNWACWLGAAQARGRYLLFTDADTAHRPGSLSRALRFLRDERLDLLSAPPFHQPSRPWERCSGPFHVLLLAATGVQQRPSSGRLFAIGQYLLFDARYYASSGGHSAVRSALAEDVALATRAVESGARYGVYTAAPLYAVRMFPDFSSFVTGWRRIVRWGLLRSAGWVPLETALHMQGLTAAGHIASVPEGLVYYGLGACLFAVCQGRYGGFSVVGALIYPLGLLLFLFVTGLAVFDLVFSQANTWRGRIYDPRQS